MDQEQKDTYHLIVIWMTHYCKDYWKTKLLFCNVITIAFVLSIPQQTKSKHFYRTFQYQHITSNTSTKCLLTTK